MNWVPVIWSVWGVSVLLMAAVSIYASRLAKDEEDQLFLADSSSHAKTEQAAIASKVGKVEPLKNVEATIKANLLSTKKSAAVQTWLNNLKKEYAKKVSYQTGYAPATTATTGATTTG